MSVLTREQLAARRAVRRRRERRRRGLYLALAAAPLVAAAAVAATLASSSERSSPIAAPSPAALADPLPSTALVSTQRPENVTLARAEGVELRLPVPRNVLTAVAFHPVETPAAVKLDPGGGLPHEIAPRQGRPGPETAAVDVGAPATTTVYSPVSGVVVSIVDPYKMFGKDVGYEMAIAPTNAAGLLVRVTHLDAPPGFKRPRVGHPVVSGLTALGRVADFSQVAEQEIARYTNDSGNHVHIEVIRAGSGLTP
jgi:murein DD-endopeptidase MepM/ murein hydrolase activator NlpD